MFKEIFTWWNGQTVGTRLWTYISGIPAGVDGQGNKYFHNKKDTKRWVIYAGEVESTYVNPEWNNWLRFTSNVKVSEDKKYKWQKNHLSN
ncbi:NADH:ubiquinone oxidoreductase subunit NDUFA12, partial [Pelagibacterales bacterium SAG-MED32]|nr:NADH:ubiquinone oxidoreductase subunit NDUFA12 [Pelagibacterales bacterium SAG-MED32]